MKTFTQKLWRGGVQGLSAYALTTDVAKDSGWQKTGVTFSNGAYDWGVKNGSSKSCEYKVLTLAGGVKLVELRAVFGINKAVSDFTTAIFFPTSIMPKSTEDVQYWQPIGGVSHYTMQLRFHNTGGFSVAAQGDTVPPDTMMSFHTFFIVSK